MANDHYTNHVAGSLIIFGMIMISVSVGLRYDFATGTGVFGIFCLVIGVIVAIPKAIPDKEESDVADEKEV